METRNKIICSECNSDYFQGSSEMADLCPDCSYHLYGYPNCEHSFVEDNCIHCGWNGKTSEYLKKIESNFINSPKKSIKPIEKF